jgi:hypothetical protein
MGSERMSEEFKSIMESSGMALWSAYCDKKMELEDANDRIFALETALRNLLTLVDKCRMIERGVGGMTIDAQIARSVYLNVPAYPFEKAREVLERISHE